MNKKCLSALRKKKIDFGHFNRSISVDSKFSKIVRTNAPREPWPKELEPLTTSRNKNITLCGRIPMVIVLEYDKVKIKRESSHKIISLTTKN